MVRAHVVTFFLAHIIQKLRGGLDTCHQQMIPRPRAGDVEKMALGVIHFLQIGVVADRFDALLRNRPPLGVM